MTITKLTNQSEIPLPLAVVLANKLITDKAVSDKVIRATQLLKSTRQFILEQRIKDDVSVDINGTISAILGTSLHNLMENTWEDKKSVKQALLALGYDDEQSSEILNNFHSEVRSEREVDGYTVTGQFDFVLNGDLYDLKTTSTFSYSSLKKHRDYQLQGSIYKWLNPELITGDFINIIYVFTDFQSTKVNTPNYPPNKVVLARYKLLSLLETRLFVKQKLNEISANLGVSNELLPECTDDERWVTAPKFSYFSNPKNTRATKNFDNRDEAELYMASKGHKGFIKEIAGSPRGCFFCKVSSICSQFKAYQEGIV